MKIRKRIYTNYSLSSRGFVTTLNIEIQFISILRGINFTISSTTNL